MFVNSKKDMIKLILLSFIILFGCSNNLQKYYFKFCSPSNELSQSLIDTSITFKIRLNRDIRFKKYKELIEKAEACYPPIDEELLHFEQNQDRILENDYLWWYSKSDGVKLPYTITNSAINYYINLIKKYQQGKFEEAGTLEMKKAEFNYSAKVNSYASLILEDKRYSNVYVVELSIKWKNICGMLCGTWFSKNRLVIFSKDDFKLLGIIGDGKTSFLIS
jgi:hypothetical protein